MARGIRKSLTSVIGQISSKMFGKMIPNFIAPLKMHFLISKRILDSLKSIFNVFRRKPSLVAPVKVECKVTL